MRFLFCSWLTCGFFSFTFLAAGCGLPASAEELTEQNFETLHRQLQPSADSLWRSIPWQVDLLAAQHVAAQNSKPIFIWAMDGHPLGCT